ncbi:DUF6232 family protein [Streptomyces sp. NPDC059525]
MDPTPGTGAPPPPPPPRRPPSQPPSPPPPAQPPRWEEAPPAREGRRLVIGVRRRMLWVGSAAIPLHNITWVDAFKHRRSRWGVFGRTLLGLTAAFVLLAAYGAGGDLSVLADDGQGVRVIVPAILVISLLVALFTPGKPVLAIEMAGGSRAVVTLPNMEELRQIAGQVVYAINHPDAEFTAVVNQFNSSNTNHFGPVVNMNGGRGNTGIKL